MSLLSEESLRTLRALRHPGGRLRGRLEQEVPFLLTGSPSVEVPVSIANELFEAGFIQIDEAAPIGDIYTFELSREGEEFLQGLTD